MSAQHDRLQSDGLYTPHRRPGGHLYFHADDWVTVVHTREEPTLIAEGDYTY